MEHSGRRIREARQRRGWTLEELSSRCGLSTSFLSQVERGRSSLSIVSLSAICGALDIPAASVVTSQRSASSTVTRADEQPTIRVPSSPVTYRWLSGAFRDRQIEVLVGEFPPGYRHPQATHGGEEFGYVLEGELTLVVEGESCVLGPEDSYHIPAAVPHGYRTSPEQGARVLWALTQQFIEWHNQMRSALAEEDAQARGVSRVVGQVEVDHGGGLEDRMGRGGHAPGSDASEG